MVIINRDDYLSFLKSTGAKMTPPVTVNNNIVTAPTSTTTAISSAQQSQHQLQTQQQSPQPLINISNATLSNINNNNNTLNNNGVAELAKAILVCWPNSHPFANRTLLLESGQLMKVGRSVARNKVSESNAIFDCKVLSRNHAVIWFHEGKFYIKDTGSSNGTFINNQRLSQATVESQPFEVHSGDIIQFGVDVLENTRKETHGCIVATLKLFLPDGRELKSLNQPSVINVSSPSIPPVDLYRLNQYIQEAGQREQILGSKLLSLQKTVEMTKKNSSISWQAMIDEDRLLCRIDMLEKNLNILKKNYTEDALKEEIIKLQEDKFVYQNSAKEALRKVYQERNDAVQKLTTIERALCSSEDECSLSREQLVKTQQQLQDLTDKFETMKSEFENKFVQNENLLRTKHEEVNSVATELEMYKEKLEFIEQCNSLEENEEQNVEQLSSVVNWLFKSDIKNVDGSESIIKAICNDTDNEYDEDFETAFNVLEQNLCDIERCVSVILSKEIVKGNELELANSNNELNEKPTNELEEEGKSKRINMFKMNILKNNLSTMKRKMKQIRGKSIELSEQLRQMNEKNDKDDLEEAEEKISKSEYDELLSKYEWYKVKAESRPKQKDYQAQLQKFDVLYIDYRLKESLINEMTENLLEYKNKIEFLETEVNKFKDIKTTEVNIQTEYPIESSDIDVQTDGKSQQSSMGTKYKVQFNSEDEEIVEKREDFAAEAASGDHESKETLSIVKSVDIVDENVIKGSEKSKTVDGTTSMVGDYINDSISENELLCEKLEEELQLLHDQNIQCEEELVLYKEKYAGLHEDNMRLHKDLMALREANILMNNRSLVHMCLTVAPIVAFIGYLLYTYFASMSLG